MNILMESKDLSNVFIPKSSVCYSITVNHLPDNKKSDIIVLEQYGFVNDGFKSESNANPIKAKCFPLGGIALNLAYFKVCTVFYVKLTYV